MAEVPPGNDAPPLLLHIHRRDLPGLLAFDDDIRAVEDAHPLDGEARSLLAIGRRCTVQAGRQWFSATLELAVQAQLLERLGTASVEVSPALPNGRRADATIAVGSRRVWIEVSALSDSDELIENFDTAASVQSFLGDPYDDARRVYLKLCDKACGPPTDLRSQLHPSEPSIVMVGDAAWRSPGHDGQGFGWALDQLTDPARRVDTSRASFLAWAECRYGSDAEAALAGLASLSAVAVSGHDHPLATFRPNLAADEEHELTAFELDALTHLLAVARAW